MGEDTPIENALSQMATAGVRRLVVTGEGSRLVGILSLDDVLDLLAEETETIGRLLRRYSPDIPAGSNIPSRGAAPSWGISPRRHGAAFRSAPT